MRKNKKIIISSLAILTTVLSITLNPINSFAATQQEVIDAARNAGVSDFYINQGLKEPDDFTSDEYDKMLVQIEKYKNTVNTYLAKYFGGNAEDYSTGDTSRESDTDFINKSLVDKQAYVQSMSESERDEFIKTMTNSERNSALKQFSTTEITQILTPLVEFAKTLGFNISIDSITENSIDMSVRDENGNIIDVSSVGVVIDDVGYSYTLPLLIAAIAFVVSGTGFAVISKNLRKRGNANE